MKLKNFVKLCYEFDSLIILTDSKEYDEKNYCDFVFGFQAKDYKNNYWMGNSECFKVNGKAYKDADISYIMPFKEKSIKVFVR